jgi:hypothetical protein
VFVVDDAVGAAVGLGECVRLDEGIRITVEEQLPVETGDFGGVRRHRPDIVFDEEDREAVVVQFVKQFVERSAGLGIDADRRPVESEEVCLARQRPWDEDALSLTAGEAADPPVDEVGDADPFERRPDRAVVGLSSGEASVRDSTSRP